MTEFNIEETLLNKTMKTDIVYIFNWLFYSFYCQSKKYFSSDEAAIMCGNTSCQKQAARGEVTPNLLSPDHQRCAEVMKNRNFLDDSVRSLLLCFYWSNGWDIITWLKTENIVLHLGRQIIMQMVSRVFRNIKR